MGLTTCGAAHLDSFFFFFFWITLQSAYTGARASLTPVYAPQGQRYLVRLRKSHCLPGLLWFLSGVTPGVVITPIWLAWGSS